MQKQMEDVISAFRLVDASTVSCHQKKNLVGGQMIQNAPQKVVQS